MQYLTFTIILTIIYSFICVTFQNESISLDDLSLVYLKWKYKQDQIKKFQDYSISSSNKQSAEISIHNSSEIYVDCNAFIFEFAKQASRFIECSIDNARPFRFCEGCVRHFRKAKTVYNDIKMNDETQSNCRKLLLDSDRVQVINSVYTDFENIWTSADCERCFETISEDNNGTVTYTLRDTTIKFLDLYANFTKCVPTNTTKFQHNNTICRDCATYYNQMNTMFDKLLNDKDSPQHVCMDIVDMMNYTRLLWGRTLNCTRFQKEYASIILIGVGFLCLPPVFYICMKVYGTKKEKEIIRQKRLSIFNQDNSFNYSVTVTTNSQPVSQNSANGGPSLGHTVTGASDTNSRHQNLVQRNR